jgi:hypothetical protein
MPILRIARDWRTGHIGKLGSAANAQLSHFYKTVLRRLFMLA